MTLKRHAIRRLQQLVTLSQLHQMQQLPVEVLPAAGMEMHQVRGGPTAPAPARRDMEDLRA